MSLHLIFEIRIGQFLFLFFHLKIPERYIHYVIINRFTSRIINMIEGFFHLLSAIHFGLSISIFSIKKV
jgi:hypothetical protein